MKHLYFIRHGQSEMNVLGLSSGHSDTPLTKTGVNQAIEAGKNVKEQQLKFDAIISSPLQRAHHTAKHVASIINHPQELIELHEDLKERDFGDLEGKDMAKDFGIELAYYYANPKSTDHIPNIETIEQLHKRAEKVYAYLKSRPEENILVVGHGAFLRSLQRVINNLPYDYPVELSDNAKIIKLI